MGAKSSVNNAIIVGYLLILGIPIALLLFLGIATSVFLESLKQQNTIDPEIFLYPIPIFLTYWIIVLTIIVKVKKKWRKWAIDNVDDLESFRSQALKARFISREDFELDELIKRAQLNNPKPSNEKQQNSFATPNSTEFANTSYQENHSFYFTDEGMRSFSFGLWIQIIPQTIAAFIAISIFFQTDIFISNLIVFAIIVFSVVKGKRILQKTKKQFIILESKKCIIFHPSYYSYQSSSLGFGLSGIAEIPWESIESISLNNKKIKIVWNNSGKWRQAKKETFIFGTKGSATPPEEIVQIMRGFLPIRSNSYWKNEV